MGTVDEKIILIGCDHTGTLSKILDNIKGISTFAFNIISASRISDVMSITKSLLPTLIIFGFRNNQLAINNFNQFVNKPDIPMLCLCEKNDFNTISYHNNIVFTYPSENISHKDSFVSLVNSILLLKNQYIKKNNAVHNKMITDSLSNTIDMSRYVLELDQKTEILLQIKDRIKTLLSCVENEARIELLSIVNAIKGSVNDEKLWDDFKLYFDQTNPNFLLSLSEKHPKLTPKDLKYCCYLKMNMSNDDIRSLLGINQESVRTHKYRLKQKMKLDKNVDLIQYIKSIVTPITSLV